MMRRASHCKSHLKEVFLRLNEISVHTLAQWRDCRGRCNRARYIDVLTAAGTGRNYGTQCRLHTQRGDKRPGAALIPL